VPPKQPNTIAESIINLYNDPELTEKLKQNGLETSKNFTWKRVVDIFENAFINVLK
jgi:glycosyltransferase involved in cell wall biosynthesis